MKFKAEATKNMLRNCVSRVAADVTGCAKTPKCHFGVLAQPVTSAATNSCTAFTLAEVLAAMVFMAILIPVAIEGLSIASRAGEVAARKGEAAVVAEKLLNESIVTATWNQNAQSGVVRQGPREFRWKLQTQPWNQDPNQTAMRLL